MNNFCTLWLFHNKYLGLCRSCFVSKTAQQSPFRCYAFQKVKTIAVASANCFGGAQSAWLLCCFSSQVVSWRWNFFWIQLMYLYLPFKQNQLLCEKLWLNPRRSFLFQKWIFPFPLCLAMLKFRVHFTEMQLLFSSVVCLLHYCFSCSYSAAEWLRLAGEDVVLLQGRDENGCLAEVKLSMLCCNYG